MSSVVWTLKRLHNVFPCMSSVTSFLKSPECHLWETLHLLTGIQGAVAVLSVGCVYVQRRTQRQKARHATTSLPSYEEMKCENVVKNTGHCSHIHGLNLFVASPRSVIAACIGAELLHQRAAVKKKRTLQVKAERYLAAMLHLWNTKPPLNNFAFKVKYQITIIINHRIIQRNKESLKNEPLSIAQYYVLLVCNKLCIRISPTLRSLQSISSGK